MNSTQASNPGQNLHVLSSSELNQFREAFLASPQNVSIGTMWNFIKTEFSNPTFFHKVNGGWSRGYVEGEYTVGYIKEKIPSSLLNDNVAQQKGLRKMAFDILASSACGSFFEQINFNYLARDNVNSHLYDSDINHQKKIILFEYDTSTLNKINVTSRSFIDLLLNLSNDKDFSALIDGNALAKSRINHWRNELNSLCYCDKTIAIKKKATDFANEAVGKSSAEIAILAQKLLESQ